MSDITSFIIFFSTRSEGFPTSNTHRNLGSYSFGRRWQLWECSEFHSFSLTVPNVFAEMNSCWPRRWNHWGWCLGTFFTYSVLTQCLINRIFESVNVCWVVEWVNEGTMTFIIPEKGTIHWTGKSTSLGSMKTNESPGHGFWSCNLWENRAEGRDLWPRAPVILLKIKSPCPIYCVLHSRQYWQYFESCC